MSFELLLMRHGHAEDFAAGGDSQRQLTERGRTDVARMKEALAAMQLDWQIAMSSPFIRAKQTLDLMGGVGEERVELVPGAHPDDTVDALVRVAEESGADRILAVGHNPNITSTLGRLVVGDPGVYFSVATSDVAHLWVDVGREAPRGAVLGFYPASKLRNLLGS